MHQRGIVVFTLAMVFLAVEARGVRAQDAGPSVDRAAGVVVDTAGGDAADSLAVAPSPAPTGLPVLVTLGIGYGRRRDPCTNCASPENTDSFTGHVSLGKRLGHGLGVGVRASVWRRGHPGPLAAADSTGTPAPTTLMNTLGNASVVFSWQLWHFWVEGGGGFAWSGEDLVDSGSSAIVHASGMGIGYSFGAGMSIPLAGPLSLAFFGNYNAGQYDLTSPTAVVDRGASHQYVELGVGLTLR